MLVPCNRRRSIVARRVPVVQEVVEVPDRENTFQEARVETGVARRRGEPGSDC